MKLLLVDDEWFTREGIMERIPWEEIGIEQVEQADDGVNALLVAEQFEPDILLTDVRMPRMDGTELAYAMREKYPSCYIIFMSGFTDKEYMKAAINVSATAYIEKPIEIVELKSAIAKAVLLAGKDKQMKDMKQHFNKSIPVLRQELALLLLRRTASEDTMLEFIRVSIPEFPIETNYVTLLVKPFPAEPNQAQAINELLFKNITQTIMNVMNREGLQVITSIKDDELVVAHCCVKGVDLSSVHEASKKLADQLNQICETQISIGSSVPSLLKVYHSYLSALANFGKQGWAPGGPSLWIAKADVIEVSGEASEEKLKKNPMVGEIVQYIDGHYQDEGLSLQQISEHMYLTPSYMCVIFKDDTNTTINQYIATVRIEKAKDMLKDNRVKVKEVAAMVGYSDSNYFAKIFKKHTGLTPVEFRELANR
jgi:YesN/AraC family two-component response regulator